MSVWYNSFLRLWAFHWRMTRAILVGKLEMYIYLFWKTSSKLFLDILSVSVGIVHIHWIGLLWWLCLWSLDVLSKFLLSLRILEFLGQRVSLLWILTIASDWAWYAKFGLFPKLFMLVFASTRSVVSLHSVHSLVLSNSYLIGYSLIYKDNDVSVPRGNGYFIPKCGE